MESFKKWLETSDIFGFDKDLVNDEEKTDELDNKPLDSFDIESMIETLARKPVGKNRAVINFMNEVQWGERSGAIKLEVSPSNTFYVKKMGFDLEGNRRWVTKKLFQLNRLGYGGYEDSVASEIYDVIQDSATGNLDRPFKDWEGMEDLVENVARKMRRVCKDIFMYEGIKKLSETNYIIVFSVRGQGVQGRDQQQVSENCTQLSYDNHQGTIRVTNYKVGSKVGRGRDWKIAPSDLDMYFFPSQNRDEISEAVATFIKYY